MKKKKVLVTAVLAMAVMLSACGTKDNKDKAGSNAEGVKTLIMATNAEFPPYEYYEGKKPVGIDVDIANAIAEDLGMELKVQDMAFDSVITAVQTGKADIGLAGITVREDRLENVNFTDTYAIATQVIIVSEGSEITTPNDLAGRTIGVQLGTTGDFLADDVNDATVERYNKGADAIEALKTGKIEAVMIDNEPAKVFVKENEGLKILDETYAQEEYAIAVAKENEDLLKNINDSIKKLKESGKLQEIIDKYIVAE